MNVGSWALRNDRVAWVAFLLIALAGVLTFRTMPRREYPDFTIRTAVIVTALPGASPLRVEQLVTDEIERRIREMPEVEHVTSQSRTGISVVTVDVNDRFDDMQPIWDRLRIKVDDARADLPDGVVGPDVNDEFGDVFGLVLALTGDGFTERELKETAEDLRDRLLLVSDVARIELHGVQEERVYVELSNARLAEIGVSPRQLAQVLAAQNAIVPAGNARVGPERVVLEATGEFRDLDDIAAVTLRLPGRPEAVRLGDVARVHRSLVDPPKSLVRHDGRPAIVVAISMAEGGNVVELGEAVRRELAGIESDLPVGLDLDFLVYQPKFVTRSITDFTVNLAEAFLFVVIVTLAFAGLRTGLVVGALVPMAMLASIALMPLLGVDLQSVSIASLIIALGMLVDNGVVVSESMLVRLAAGEERPEAVGNVVSELWRPLLAASLTTVCAFLPIGLAQSVVGEYTVSLVIVVTLTLLASWVLSLTLVPMLCALVLKPAREEATLEGRGYRAYRAVLLPSLRRPWAFVAAAVAVTALGTIGFGLVENIFFPPNERETFTVDAWQPAGTDVRETAARVEGLESFLLDQEEVDSVGTFVGDGGPRWYLSLNPEPTNASYALLVVNTREAGEVGSVIERTRAFLDETAPDMRHTVRRLEQGPPVGAPVQVRISGDDVDVLYALRDRVAAILKEEPGVANVRDDWDAWTKKLVVDVDQDQAKRAGLSSQDVALSLQSQVSGMQATELRQDDETIPVVLRAAEAWREDLGLIEGLNVYSFATGRNVPLSQVARTRLEWQPSTVRRRDQRRTLTVKADLTGRTAADVLASVGPRLEALVTAPDWPAGHGLELGGEQEESAKAQASILAGVPLAFGLLALVLIALFNSLRRPIIIALTIPPSIAGVTAGLLLTDAPFGFMALLGLISLVGIVVNNAIMVIDRIEIERGAGRDLPDAIVTAAQLRLRPILMTATTTVVGLVPLSLQGGEFWRPMANVMIAGLAFGTILTLVLCPVLYALFFGARFAGYRWKGVS